MSPAEPRAESRTRSRVEGRLAAGADRVALLGLLALVLWAPVPLGSNRPWSSGLLGAGVGLVVAGWALARLPGGAALPRALREHRFALTCLGLWVAYTLVQALALPGALVEALAPASADAYGLARGTGAQGGIALSVDRASTMQALVRHAAYAGLAMLALATLDSRRRLRLALHVLVIVGTAEAAYGIVAHLGGETLGLWRPGVASGGGVTGTYVNRNHLAGLLELTIPAALALLWLEASARPRGHGARGWLIASVDVVLGPGLVYGFAVLLMTAALMLTGSRGGVAAWLLALAITVVIGSVGRVGLRALAGRVVALGILPALAVAWLGADALTAKLASEGLASNRGELREIAYHMIADRPLTGSGAGTYRWVFPAYKDARFGAGFYEHVHNDALELLVEQGVLGAALALAGVAALLLAAIRGALARRDPVLRAALFASIAGVLALLAHGAVDFNLQIPANAALFFVLLGLGAAAATAPSSGRAEAS